MALPRLVLLAAIVVFVCACAEPQNASSPSSSSAVAIYLVAHERHTGLILPRADIPAGLWPESRDFPQANYLEVGWGERDYYQGRDRGLRGTLKAALWPTPSVLHVVGVRGPVARYFRTSEVIKLMLTRDGFERLVRYVHNAHERTGAADALGPGLYGNSRFYPAWESFHLFRNCNVWTARGLRTAGLPIHDSITRQGIMSQARAIGEPFNAP